MKRILLWLACGSSIALGLWACGPITSEAVAAKVTTFFEKGATYHVVWLEGATLTVEEVLDDCWIRTAPTRGLASGGNELLTHWNVCQATAFSRIPHE